ncbi:MAG: DNA polymerase-1 [Planctomycetota bacterium]|jgi:DNA polymerase-1
MQSVHLIDALPYVFRAYFSLPSSIRDRAGKPANAARGYSEFLLRYLGDEEPTHVACLFDESLNTSFRNDEYPEYKAQRELPPKELEDQLDACQRVSRALGIATYSDPRYEADDLIGTLALPLTKEGNDVIVVTSDKDLAQLVDDHVTFYDYAKGVRYGADGVIERWGVRPEQVIDFLGLAGDSVDNIPGVRGVGPKTAVALLGTFDDLESLYADLDQVASIEVRGAKTLAAKLETHKDMAFLSKRLATLAFDAPVKAGLCELSWSGAQREALEQVFEELGFPHFTKRVKKWASD